MAYLEATTYAVTITGLGAYPIGDYMLDLPDSRVDLLRKTLPTLPVLPSDLFSRGSTMTFNPLPRHLGK